MLVYAGIDEAGYGPRLGPLCVALAAFPLGEADAASPPPDLWRQLRAAVCRRGRDRKHRIAIDDIPAHPGFVGARHMIRKRCTIVPRNELRGHFQPAPDKQ